MALHKPSTAVQAGQLFRKHKRKTPSGVHAWKNRKTFWCLVTHFLLSLYPLVLPWMLFEGCLKLHPYLGGEVGTASQKDSRDASMTKDCGDGTCLEDETPDLGLSSHLG